MRCRSLISILLFICPVIFIASCAPKVSVLRLVPAKFKIENIRSVGIVPLANSASENPGGSQYITESLYKSLGWRNFFDVVRHIAPKETLNYHQIKNMPPTVAAKLGREAGVDGLIKGDIFAYRVNSDNTTKRVEREEGTGQYRTVTRVENGQSKTERVEIMKKVAEDVPVTHRKAEAGFVLDVANVKQERWTDRERFYKSKELNAEGNDNIAALPSNDAVLHDLASAIVTQAADSFVPHIVAEKRSLAKDTASKDGIKMAKKGDWKGALASWQEAALNDPQNDAAFYNMGVAYEGLKDYKSAKNLYEKAAALSDKKLYRDAVKSIQTIIADEGRLNIQIKGRDNK